MLISGTEKIDLGEIFVNEWMSLGRELSVQRREGITASCPPFFFAIIHTQINMLILLVLIKSLWGRHSYCFYPHVGQESKLRVFESVRGSKETEYLVFVSLLLVQAMWPCQATAPCLSLFPLGHEEKDNEKLTSLNLLGGSSQLN